MYILGRLWKIQWIWILKVLSQWYVVLESPRSLSLPGSIGPATQNITPSDDLQNMVSLKNINLFHENVRKSLTEQHKPTFANIWEWGHELDNIHGLSQPQYSLYDQNVAFFANLSQTDTNFPQSQFIPWPKVSCLLLEGSNGAISGGKLCVREPAFHHRRVSRDDSLMTVFVPPWTREGVHRSGNLDRRTSTVLHRVSYQSQIQKLSQASGPWSHDIFKVLFSCS